MISVHIPGRGSIDIEAVAFDMNGTIAQDGEILPGVKVLLERLSEEVKVVVLTADTFSKAFLIEKDMPFVELFILPAGGTGLDKETFLKSFGKNVASVGNGCNDMRMFKVSVLSIAVMGREGMCRKLLDVADIVVTDVRDAIGLFLNPMRLVATLRA